jgi:hypothetical protein
MPDSKEFRQVRKNPGIVTNLPTTSVAWASGKNVRFRPGAVMKCLGKSVLATVSDSPGGGILLLRDIPLNPANAYSIREVFTFRGHDGVWRTIVCCDTKIYSYTDDFTSYTDITPATAPTGDETSIWTFALIGGLPILSNYTDPPWQWANYSGVLTTLTNAPNRARGITSNLGRIIAGGLQDGAYDFKNRIKWTKEPFHPTGWIPDLKSTADRQDLVNPNTGEDAWEEFQAFGRRGTKRVIDYTSKNVWKMDAIDSIMDYHIDVLYEGIGLIAPRARTNYMGIEFFMGETDFYMITDELKPIGFDIRNSVFPNLNKSMVYKSFAFCKPSTREVVFCFTTGTNSSPDTAAAYNYELKNWTFYSINFNCHTFGYSQTNYQWDTIPFGSQDSITDSSWDEMSTTGILPYEVVGNDLGQILKLEDTHNDNDSAIEAYIETGDMGSDEARLMALQVVPFLKPTGSSNPLMIQIGTRESLDREIKWSQPKPFTEGVSKQVGGRATGHFVRYRFFTDQVDSPFIIEGFRNYYEVIGG